MKNKIINLCLLILLLLLAQRMYQTDFIDRTNPFGTDEFKNKKYTNGQSGEDFGVGTFWGKPSKDDALIDHLDKIQWLSDSPFNDIIWRRAGITGIVGGILLCFVFDKNILFEEPIKLMFSIVLIFVFIYFSNMYYIQHVLLRRKKFIHTHVRKMKKKLRLSLSNKIDENPVL